MHLFLFIPGQHIATLDELERVGHGGYVDREIDGSDDRLAIFPHARGPSRAHPGGVDGTVVIIRGRNDLSNTAPPAIDLDKQFWQSTVAPFEHESVPAWVGYWRDFPPTPATLVRRTEYIGTAVPLNGEPWLLPLLQRLPLEGLPYSLREGPREPTAADVLAHRVCCELRDSIRAAVTIGNDKPPPPGARALVEYALGLNYRGDWRTWEALGLFDGPPRDTTWAMLGVLGVLAELAMHDRGLV